MSSNRFDAHDLSVKKNTSQSIFQNEKNSVIATDFDSVLFIFFLSFFHPPADLLDKWLAPYNEIDFNTEYALKRPNSRIDSFHMFVIAVGDPILAFSFVDRWIAMWSNYEWLWWIFIEVAEFHWCHTIAWSRTYRVTIIYFLPNFTKYFVECQMLWTSIIYSMLELKL